MNCICGHPLSEHTEHDDVPCEGTNFVAPGSFESCECPGFTPKPRQRKVYAYRLVVDIPDECSQPGFVPDVLVEKEQWRLAADQSK